MRVPRAAIVHYWLLGMRGGEKVVEALCSLLPNADLFTLFYEPENVSPLIRSRNVTASFLNPLRKAYRSLLPLMPFALEQFDLRGYDLVVSSESGPAKGVLTSSSARHICYCHTPMRYLWELYPDYFHEWSPGLVRKVLLAPFANYLRIWDCASALRVDEFVANSRNVQRRIWKTYRRESQVIYPPVDVEQFYWKEPRDYYLIVSELVAYKRIETAVRLFSASGRKLRIVGSGPQYRHLKRMARPNIEFCGHVSDEELRALYACCSALLIPGEEDFGITAVEALASGKPVIALGRGGVLESVPTQNARAGFFYPEPEEDQLAQAISRFECEEPLIPPEELQEHAAKFRTREFEAKFSRLLQHQQESDLS